MGEVRGAEKGVPGKMFWVGLAGRNGQMGSVQMGKRADGKRTDGKVLLRVH